MNGQKSNN